MSIRRNLDQIAKHGYSQLLSKRVDQFGIDFWPTHYDSAKGTEVYIGKEKYIDLSISGIGACALGYANEYVDNAVIRQIKNGVASSLNSHLETQAAEKLLSHHKWADSVRFSKSGGEAMAIAVRMARSATGREKIGFCGYHGWHDWYLASNIGNKDNLNDHLLSNLDPTGVPTSLKGTSIPFKFDSIDSFLNLFDKYDATDYAAIVLEPARDKRADLNWLKFIKEFCQKNNIVLIFDEISSGFRATTGGIHKEHSVEPDLCVFAKALGNGFPISAIIGMSSIMLPGGNNFISSTNWTESSGLAAMIAVLDFYEENNVGRFINSFGEKWQNSISQIRTPLDVKISTKGIGGLSGWKINSQGDAFRTYFSYNALNKGYLVSNRLYPNYAMHEDHINQYAELMEESLRDFFEKGISLSQMGRIMPMGLNLIKDL